MSRVYSFSRIISGALSASRPVQKSAISGSVSRTWSRGLASTAPRSSSSRAFLLEDPGVGLAEHERLSELSSPARWRHAQEVEIARKEKELERAAQALKDGTGALQGQRRTFSYSMAPVKAMYDRAAARKAARRSNWPQLPDGETLMEPVWTAYGNFKALVFAGIWVVVLLPTLLGVLLFGEEPAEPSPEAVRAVLDAEAKATGIR